MRAPRIRNAGRHEAWMTLALNRHVDAANFHIAVIISARLAIVAVNACCLTHTRNLVAGRVEGAGIVSSSPRTVYWHVGASKNVCSLCVRLVKVNHANVPGASCAIIAQVQIRVAGRSGPRGNRDALTGFPIDTTNI